MKLLLSGLEEPWWSEQISQETPGCLTRFYLEALGTLPSSLQSPRVRRFKTRGKKSLSTSPIFCLFSFFNSFFRFFFWGKPYFLPQRGWRPHP